MNSRPWLGSDYSHKQNKWAGRVFSKNKINMQGQAKNIHRIKAAGSMNSHTDLMSHNVYFATRIYVEQMIIYTPAAGNYFCLTRQLAL